MQTRVMRELFEVFYRRLANTDTRFTRYLYHRIRWNAHLLGILGARGAGKTTMILQRIRMEFGTAPTQALYVSLDNLYFSTHTLLDLVRQFHQNGGTHLFLDEVHRYPNWSAELKQIYDDYPQLYVVFTGSSLLQLEDGKADLSRRATMYYLHGLSFREYLEFDRGLIFPVYSIEEVLHNHVSIAADVVKMLHPLPAFREYLEYGYYPFYKEDKEAYHDKLLATFTQIMEQDLPAVVDIEYTTIQRIKKLFGLIAQLVPLVPNITALSRDLGTTRLTLLNYLYYLSRAKAVLTLDKASGGLKPMAKPEKIYLGNTNYAYAFAREKTDVGNVRETFFVNQLEATHRVTYAPSDADFLIDDTYTFEVGGANKSQQQIRGVANAYLVLDNIEQGFAREIPLWLFGMLY